MGRKYMYMTPKVGPFGLVAYKDNYYFNVWKGKYMGSRTGSQSTPISIFLIKILTSQIININNKIPVHN